METKSPSYSSQMGQNGCTALLMYFKNKNMTVYSSPYQLTTKARSCYTLHNYTFLPFLSQSKNISSLSSNYLCADEEHLSAIVSTTPDLEGISSTFCACDGCIHDACTITSVPNMENMGNMNNSL